MVVVFIAHLLKVTHAGCVDVVDRLSIFIDLVDVVVVVVIIDDEFVLVVFFTSNAIQEEVFGETQRSQHREDVEEQTEQGHRRGQVGERGGTDDENVLLGRGGGGRERGSRVSPFEG